MSVATSSVTPNGAFSILMRWLCPRKAAVHAEIIAGCKHRTAERYLRGERSPPFDLTLPLLADPQARAGLKKLIERLDRRGAELDAETVKLEAERLAAAREVLDRRRRLRERHQPVRGGASGAVSQGIREAVGAA